MNWKFWKSRRNSQRDESLDKLIKETSLLNNKVTVMEENLLSHIDIFQNINQQIESNEDLIQKSLRLHYKSYQETIKMLEQVNNTVNKISQDDGIYAVIEKENDRLIREKEYMVEKYIIWLDDIDLIYDNLNGQGQEDWMRLLESWQMQISKSLEAIGVYEIDVLGKSFNSVIAEAVGTIKRESNVDMAVYQVMEVLQRGYILKDGSLLRKAKVITVEEEDYENER